MFLTRHAAQWNPLDHIICLLCTHVRTSKPHIHTYVRTFDALTYIQKYVRIYVHMDDVVAVSYGSIKRWVGGAMELAELRTSQSIFSLSGHGALRYGPKANVCTYCILSLCMAAKAIE